MKGILAVSVIFLSAAIIWTTGPQGQEPAKERNPVMQKKLEHSQKVLEGIATRDFNLIAENADELILLSKRAEWRILPTPEYTVQSNDFRRNAANLIRQAKGKNLDAAALAYVQLTLNCVDCHKYVREVRTTQHDPRPLRESMAGNLPQITTVDRSH